MAHVPSVDLTKVNCMEHSKVMSTNHLPPRKGTNLTPTYRATPGKTGPVSKTEYQRSNASGGNGKKDYRRSGGQVTPTTIPMTKNR